MALIGDPTPALSDSPAGGGEANPWADYFAGMGKSALWTLPELIGIEAPAETQQWRYDNPGGALLSEFGLPLGEFAAAARIGKWALRGSEGMRLFSESHPFLGAVAESQMGMGGITAARLAGAAIAGGDMGQVAQSSLVDQAMAAGLGGLQGLTKLGGTPELTAGENPFGLSDLNLPLQHQGRELSEKLRLGQLPDKLIEPAKARLEDITRLITTEADPKQARGFMRPITQTVASTLGDMHLPAASSNRALNRLFSIRATGASEAEDLAAGAPAGTKPSVPIVEPAPPAPGMTRMYHGGGAPEPSDRSAKWFSSDRAYADGYAAKSADGQVHYVDLPTDHPLIKPEYPEQSIAAGFHRQVELPGDIAASRQPIGTGATPGPDLPGVPGVTPAKLSPWSIVKRKLTVGTQGFLDKMALSKVEADATLPEGYQFNGQHFRHISFTNDGAAKRISNVVTKNMLDVGDGWYLAKEQDIRTIGGAKSDQGGLYVMAKKVSGDTTKAGTGDQWLVFKTDKPGFFKPAEARFADEMSRWSWDPAEDAVRQARIDAHPLMHFADDLNKNHPLTVLQTAAPGIFGMGRGMTPKVWSEVGSKVLSKVMGWGEGGDALRAAGRFFNEFIAPAMHQFKGSLRAQRVYSNMRAVFDRAEAEVVNAIHGSRSGLIEGSPWRAMLSKGGRLGGWAADVKALTPAQFAQFNEIWRNPELRGLPVDRLPAVFGPEVRKVVDEMQRLSNGAYASVKGAEDAAEIADGEGLRHLSGHMGISRTWRGKFRIRIRDENGNLIAMAGGRERGAAQKMAKALIEEARVNGKRWTTDGKVFGQDAFEDLSAEKAMQRHDRKTAQIIYNVEAAGRPATYKPRADIGGYIGEKDFTPQELIDLFQAHMLTLSKMTAGHTVNTVLKTEMEALHQENPALLQQINERMEQLMGRSGEFTRWQNRMADKLLARYIGHNSATKLAQAFSTAIYALRYSFGSLSLPVMSILNFTQTHYGEMAYLADGAPEDLARAGYTHALMLGKDGVPRGKVGLMSMTKLQFNALRQLRNPDAGFRRIVSEAVNNGEMDPKLVQEFIGDKASVRDHFKAFREAKGPEKGLAMAKLFMSIASWPAETIEKLSRMQTYALAYNYGEKVIGLSSEVGRDQALKDFMKQFTNRTMFMYGTADRPKIFSGPIGSSLGLTKNWMMHYIYNIMDYLGAANKGNLRPLIYTMALPAVAGGIGATGGLFYVADQISRLFNNKPLMERIYEAFGDDDPSKPTMADLIWQGLPGWLPKFAHMPGISLTQSLSAPMRDPAGELSWMVTPAVWDQGKLAYKALATLKAGYDATGTITPDALSQVARAFSPKTFYRGMNAWSDGMIRSASTTAPEITDLTPMERLFYTLGINPSRVANYYELKSILQAEQADLKGTTSTLGREYAIAEDTGNSEMMKRVFTKAMVKGIDITKVMNSARGYSKRFNENGLTNRFNKTRALALQRLTGVNTAMPLADLAANAGL